MKRASIAGLLSLLASCNTSSIDTMAVQPKYLAYRPSTFYPDRRSMRLPPAGAIPRERLLGPAPLLTGSGAAGSLRQIPIPVSFALLQRGRRRFDVVCAACHGLLGDGHSPVASKMSLRPPPSLIGPGARRMADGQLFRVMSAGYGMMPSYDSLLTTADRWAVVSYIRALQMSQNATLAEVPEPWRSRLAAERP